MLECIPGPVVSAPPNPTPATLAWPIGWVRCAWCKKVVPYGSSDLVSVKRKRVQVLMHKQCAHEAELHDWNKEPPLHGGD